MTTRPGDATLADVRLSVLVADHRRAFSEGLAQRLAQEPDVVVVSIAESLDAAETALDALHPTVGAVASDLRGGGGLVLVMRARQSHPTVRWVVVGADGGPLDLADALMAGASGYVTMRSPVAALAQALRGAMAGLSITPDELLRRALMELDTAGTGRHQSRCAEVAGGGRGRSGRTRPTPSTTCPWSHSRHG